MKYLFYLLLFFTCFSCNNATKQPAADSAKAGTSSVDTGKEAKGALTERERLIKALEKLQQDIASKNKEVIAAYFQFPIESDALQAFEISESFDKQVAQNNHLVSRSLFVDNFDALYDNLEMGGLAELFDHLKLDKLKDTTMVLADVKMANNVCTHSYSVATQGKEVTLQYGVYTNEEYNSKHPNNEADECAEYAAFWTFTFDGEKLLFNRHQVAG